MKFVSKADNTMLTKWSNTYMYTMLVTLLYESDREKFNEIKFKRTIEN